MVLLLSLHSIHTTQRCVFGVLNLDFAFKRKFKGTEIWYEVVSQFAINKVCLSPTVALPPISALKWLESISHMSVLSVPQTVRRSFLTETRKVSQTTVARKKARSRSSTPVLLRRCKTSRRFQGAGEEDAAWRRIEVTTTDGE